MRWKMFLEWRPIDGRSSLFIRKDRYQSEGGGRSFVSSIEMITVPDNAVAPCALSSGFSQDDDPKAFLQAALDCAWEAGMRPAGWEDHGREVSALRDHLHDMRALVYAGNLKPEEKLPPPLPSSGQKQK